MGSIPALKILSSGALLSRAELRLCTHIIFRKTVPRRSVNYLTDPANTGKRTSGINFDTVGSWNNRMDLAINMEESIRRGRLIPFISLEDVGAVSLCGRRPKNEDRTIACQLTHNLLMFGMCDGHGGHEAAEYVVRYLPVHIKHWLETGESDLSVVLHRAFLDVNNGFTRDIYRRHVNLDVAVSTRGELSTETLSGQAVSTNLTSGTTATVCLVRNSTELVIAHVGDSRALICRKDTALRLTKDHEPESSSECSRIERCGGRVVWSSVGRPRVNGVLEMTRSIGDIELKQFGVTAEPEVHSVEIRHGSDAFLALTSDGIHTVLNSGEIVQIVSSCLNTHEAAHLVVDQALQYGSSDNCTALVVPFGAWGKFRDGASTPRPVVFARGSYFVNRT